MLVERVSDILPGGPALDILLLHLFDKINRVVRDTQ